MGIRSKVGYLALFGLLFLLIMAQQGFFVLFLIVAVVLIVYRRRRGRGSPAGGGQGVPAVGRHDAASSKDSILQPTTCRSTVNPERAGSSNTPGTVRRDALGEPRTAMGAEDSGHAPETGQVARRRLQPARLNIDHISHIRPETGQVARRRLQLEPGDQPAYARIMILRAIDICERDNLGSKARIRRIRIKIERWSIENERDIGALMPDYQYLLDLIEGHRTEDDVG